MLLCLTANHRNASFDLLEKLSFGAQSAASDLVASGTTVRGAVVLATCNRFEAYLDVTGLPETGTGRSLDTAVSNTVTDAGTGTTTDAGTRTTTDTPVEPAVTAAFAAMSRASGVDPVTLERSATVLRGDDVVAHLFAVSSGLESVVLGEDEISGQVRRALEQARAVGTTTPALEQLFQRASTTSRSVRTTTAVGTAGRSLVRLALDLASSRVTDWSETRVLMIGTGAYAGASVAALRECGAENVTVYSPSGRAPKFALGHGIGHTTDLRASLAGSDVILTCTTATGHVVTPELLQGGTRKLVIDLGLPRNVEPAVAEIEGIDLLDLETISLHAPLADLTATGHARDVIGQATAAFAAVAAEQALTPAVVALRRHIFDLLDAEIDRARSRGDSSPQTEAALRHLASVLVHTPSVRARELARAGDGAAFTDGLAALFGIVVTDVVPIADAAARAGDTEATAS